MQTSRVSQAGQQEADSRLNRDDRQHTRIIIAECHDLARSGMRALLDGVNDITIVGEAVDGDGALRLINEKRPDIAILDISMPGLSGTEVARLVRGNYPEVKVLIVTLHEDADCVSEIARSGANGYILKNADSVEIVRAVRTVAASSKFFSPTIPQPKIDMLIRRAAERHRPRSAGNLTQREREVLFHISEGLTSRAIAEKLSLSLNTVNTHRMNIMKKLDVHNTAGLVKYALQHGLTGLDF